jgi:Domain of unknown function (DUF4388)
MKIRGTATNQLSDVIQALSLARKTGTLVIERDGIAGSSEMGTITFHNGQITDANVGPFRGADAFKRLITWKMCHFVLQPPSVTSTSPPSLPQLPGPNIQSNTTIPADHSEAYPPPFVDVVPYRTQLFQGSIPDFQQLGLSRMHRQLFLLIDGKRSLQGLTRLIGRHQQEVHKLLADLEQAGLIHQ